MKKRRPETDLPEDEEQEPGFDDLPLENQVLLCGQLKYTPEHIARILGLDPKATSRFILRLSTPEDPLKISYEKGLARADLDIDSELYRQGKKGDVFAFSQLGNRQYYRRLDSLRKELFDI